MDNIDNDYQHDIVAREDFRVRSGVEVWTTTLLKQQNEEQCVLVLYLLTTTAAITTNENTEGDENYWWIDSRCLTLSQP